MKTEEMTVEEQLELIRKSVAREMEEPKDVPGQILDYVDTDH